MGKNKLKKFAENETFDKLLQPEYELLTTHQFDMRGHWRSRFFKNDHPIILEIGCGKGEYTVGLAERYPTKNFIGVDRKGARLWAGCKKATEQEMPNVGFVRTKAENLTLVFAENEIDEIWITFPDPQSRKPKADKRLTSPVFLDKYSCFLKKGGIIHLKTDSQFLAEYTLDVIKEKKLKLLYCTDDLYQSDCQENVISIQTFYESIWLKQGLSIHYIKYEI